MKSILAMTAALAMATAGLAAAGAAPAEARTYKSSMRAPRPHKPRAPKSTYRTVRVTRSDGTVMTGYRDAMGTHLHGPDGRTIHCRRQTAGAADIDVACR